MTFPIFLMIVGCIFVAAMLYRSTENLKKDSQRHCMTCGISGQPKQITKGNVLIEIVLWLCFIIPGLIYSIWRLSSRYKACPSCGGTTLVPIESPAAVSHRKSLQA
ncbi:YqaE/Pmp3 family membrane protein [Rhodoferax ferrireducens]|uniref:YqaE/Pmp3 family membrane protein n=1 Tax=Rhodoferax ferrireducens TaxID=192843 RepID=UPI000E0CEC4E|nr:YqaE/Pmp3 family membrane protein [Rhodoferax ferrireducens]